MRFQQQILITLCFFTLASCLPSTDAEKAEVVDKGWTKANTTYFTLYAQPGVRSQDSLQAIGQKMESIQQQLLALLGESGAQKLELYFLKDRETLASYTGYPAKGYTDTKKGILYFVDKNPYHLPLKHEMMHALSWRLWGQPKEYWISEGLAVFANHGCGGYALHSLAQGMNREHKLVPIQNLVDSFNFQALEPSLQAASVVQFIYDSYGVAALKAFWQKGWQSAISIIALPARQLEQQWRKWIQQDRFKASLQWNRLKENGCE